MKRPAIARATVALVLATVSLAGGWANAGAMPATAAVAARVMPAGDPANPADPAVVALATQLGNNPTAIFNHVRDQVGVEIYGGSLRGARGTINARAGNALDRASLVVALLRASGFTARYAQGALSDDDISREYQRMLPAAQRMLGCYNPLPIPPGIDATTYTEARSHTWVEYKPTPASPYTPLDPTFADALPGQAFAAVIQTFDSVPAAQVHRLRFRVDAETYSQAGALYGFGLGSSTVLDVTIDAADLDDRPVTVGHFVSQQQPPALVISATTNTYSPYLMFGSPSTDPRSYPLLRGTDFSETYTNFPLGSTVVTGIFLRIDVVDPANPGNPATFERAVFDRIGYAARNSTGTTIIDTGGSGDPAVTPLDLFTVLVTPGRQALSTFAARKTRLDALQAETASIRDAVLALPPPAQLDAAQIALQNRAATLNAALLVALNETATTSFMGSADRANSSNAPWYLVKPFVASPRLTIGRSQVAGTALRLGLDVRRGEQRVYPSPGVSYVNAQRYEQARGLYESSIEADVLEQMTGAPVASLPRLLSSIPDPTSMTFIGSANATAIDDLALSAEAKARIATTVAAGRFVLTPQAPVTVNGAPYTAWLETDPATGYTISTGEDGTHQAIVEYANTIAFAQKYNEPFARFIGQVNAFGITSIAYSAAVLTGIVANDPFASDYQRTKAVVKDTLDHTLKPIKKAFKEMKQALDLKGAWSILGGLISGLSDGFDNQDKILKLWLGDPPVGSILMAPRDPPLPSPIAPGAAPGVTLTLTPDPRFTLLTGGAELPTVYVARVTNTGPATDVFRVEDYGADPPFQQFYSRPDLRLAPGASGEVSVCLTTGGALPPPGSSRSFNSHVRSLTNNAVFADRTATMTTPVARALLLRILPEGATALPGATVAATLTLDSLGNTATPVTLTATANPGLTVGGLPASVNLAAGETRSLPLAFTLAATAPPGASLTAVISGEFGATDPETAPFTVNVTSPFAACTSRAALEANRLGRSGLGAVLAQLAPDIDALHAAPADPARRQAVLAELDNLTGAQFNAPYLAQFVVPMSAQRSALAAAPPAGVAAVLAQVDAVACQLATALDVASTENFRLAITPTVATNIPTQTTSVAINVANDTAIPRAFDITVSGVPGGVVATLNAATITVPAYGVSNGFAMPTLTVSFANSGGTAQAFSYLVTATPRDQPAAARTTSGELVLRPDLVRLTRLSPTPAFADAGTPIAVAARAMNSLNRPREVILWWEARDSANIVRRSGHTASVTFASGDSLLDLPPFNVDTTGFASGTFRLNAWLSDAAVCCDALPGSATNASFLVGQPFSARLTVAPEVVPAGSSTATVSLELARDSLPTPSIVARSSLGVPAAARSLGRNGAYLYVCQSDRVSIVDTTDPDAPTIVGTFATGLLAADYSTVGCNVDGNRLVLAWSGDSPSSFDAVKVVAFDIGGANAIAPVQLTATPVDLGKLFGGSIAFAGATGYLTTSIYIYNPFSFFIFEQHGNLLALDFSAPAAPTLAGELFRHFPPPSADTNHPQYGGPNMINGIVLAGNYALAASTTSTGGAPQVGVGRLTVVDRTQLPTACAGDPNPCIARNVDVPQARYLFGIARQGNVAVAVGDTSGFYDGISGLTGNLTVTAFDIANPANPTVISTLVTPLLNRWPEGACNRPTADSGGSTVTALPNNFYAVGGFNPQSCSWVLTLIDANDPAHLRVIPYDVTDVLATARLDGDKLFALTRTGLLVYDYAVLAGPAVTATVEVPKGTGVTLVPGSFSLAPTTVDTGAPDRNRYVWAQPSLSTITWQVQLAAVQPGETRTVALGGDVDFTLPSLGSGSVPLNPVAVSASNLMSISPPAQTVGLGATANYTVTLTNSTGSPVSWNLAVAGVPASFVQALTTPLLVPANGQAQATLTLASSLADPGWNYLFAVHATAAGGVSTSAQANFVTNGYDRNTGVDNTQGTHGSTVVVTPQPVTVGRGQTGLATLRVSNVGTTRPSFGFAAATVPPGWTLTFDRADVPTMPRAFTDFVASIGAPTNAAPGNYTVEADLFAFNSPQYRVAIPVTVAPQGVRVAIVPGSGTTSTVYSVDVQNTGTTTDTFDLSALGPLGPAATIVPSAMTIAPGAVGSASATFAGAGYLPPGTSRFEVEARSRGTPLARARASAQVTVPGTRAVAVAGVPAAFAVPSAPASRTFGVELRNAGNQEDVYQLAIVSTAGAVSASLRNSSGAAVQSLSPMRLPGNGRARFVLDATLASGAGGSVTVRATSLTDGAVVADAVLTIGIVSSTVTTLVAAPAPAPAGTTFLLTASVSGVGPTGTVGFRLVGDVLWNCAMVPLTGGGNVRTAQCPVSFPNVGAYTFTATYSGDLANLPSTGSVLQTITANAAAACGGFIDMPTASPFCPNVEWLKNRRVTLGCTATQYCPDDPVTRLQMAAFMNRLGTALTPAVLFVSAAPGALDPDGDPVVCQTADFAGSSFPRRAFVDAIFSGIATAELAFAADLVASFDQGASWAPLAAVGSRGGLAAGQWGHTRSFGTRDLDVGQTVRFGLWVSRGGAAAATDFADSRCKLRATIGNGTSGYSPLDR